MHFLIHPITHGSTVDVMTLLIEILFLNVHLVTFEKQFQDSYVMQERERERERD